MKLPEVKVIARWIDRLIAILWVGNLAWVTWQLGGVMPATMVVGLPWASGLAGWVALRWWVIAPTGAPRGWWIPLPLLAWVTCHMLGLAELPSRGWLHGWHVWSGLAAYWLGLHLARDRKLWPMVMTGVGVITLGIAGAAVYQRMGDATWLPLGRIQVEQYRGRSAGTFGYPNAMAAWMAIVLPVAGAYAFRPNGGKTGARVFAAIVMVGALVGIGLSYSRGVTLAVITTMAVFWLIKGGWTLPRRIGVIVALGATLAGLVWWGYQGNAQVQQRVGSFVEHKGERMRPLLWGIAFDLWRDRPLVGNGGDSFDDLMELHRPEGLWESARYAHNDYLNGLSDYGLVGAGLALFACVMFTRQASQNRTNHPGLMVGLATVMVAMVVDFHLQFAAIWWLLAMGMGCLVATEAQRRNRKFTNSKQGFLTGLGAGIALICWVLPLALSVPTLEAEELRWRAREKLDGLGGEIRPDSIKPVASAAVDSLRRAVAIDSQNEKAWQDLSYALSLQRFGQSEYRHEMGVEAEFAAREALRASDRIAEHWLRLGVALDMQGRWAEAGPAFGRAISLAPRQPVMWYYQGFHLSLKPATHELAKAALATCLRLDPWYDQAKLLRAELERTP